MKVAPVACVHSASDITFCHQTLTLHKAHLLEQRHVRISGQQLTLGVRMQEQASQAARLQSEANSQAATTSALHTMCMQLHGAMAAETAAKTAAVDQVIHFAVITACQDILPC